MATNKGSKTQKQVTAAVQLVRRTHPALRILDIVLVIGTVLVFAAIGIGFGYAQANANVVYPNVHIAGMDVGGKTRGEVTALLEHAVSTYNKTGLTITIEHATLHPTPEQAGLTINLPSTIDIAFAVHRESAVQHWLAFPFQKTVVSVPVSVTYDAATLNSYMAKQKSTYSVAAVEPSLVVQNGTVSITPGSDGRAVVQADVTSQVVPAVAQLSPVTVTLRVRTVHPKLSDADLADAQTTMQTMVSGPLTLETEKKRFTVTSDVLATWLSEQFDPAQAIPALKNGVSIVLDQKMVDAYLTTMNTQIGVAPKPTDGYHAEVDGEYAYKKFEGTQVNTSDTRTNILNALQLAKNRTATVAMETAPPIITWQTITSPKPVGKAISVDIGKQEAYAFEDGVLKFWTHVSTGVPGHDTPTGEWKVYNKTPIQRMVGQGYNLPNVKWVMPYNGDYTLHTAYWHTNFGHVMSHGCTNMSEKDAKWMYDWAVVGTPVIIFDSRKS